MEATEFQIVQHTHAKFELNKLVIDENISIDDWKSLGRSLKQVEGSVQFWIGDWARFGEKQGFTGKYVAPAVYDELEEITGYSRKTLKTFKSIADRTADLRESTPIGDDVPYNHFKEIAPLPLKEQKEFLQKASDENLTAQELREEIQQFKNNTENEMTTETEPTEKRAASDYSHIETLRRLDRKRDAENEIIALARKLKKDFKKDNYSIFIQVFTNTLNK